MWENPTANSYVLLVWDKWDTDPTENNQTEPDEMKPFFSFTL